MHRSLVVLVLVAVLVELRVSVITLKSLFATQVTIKKSDPVENFFIKG